MRKHFYNISCCRWKRGRFSQGQQQPEPPHLSFALPSAPSALMPVVTSVTMKSWGHRSFDRRDLCSVGLLLSICISFQTELASSHPPKLTSGFFSIISVNSWSLSYVMHFIPYRYHCLWCRNFCIMDPWEPFHVGPKSFSYNPSGLW